ncbi:MAG: DHH family phosphoesterase [Candidatus Kapaibacteriota bacterium]
MEPQSITNSNLTLNSIPDFETTASKLISIFEYYNNFLIMTHSNPDGDAVGSSLALYHYLIQKSKNVTITTQSPIPSNLQFLSGINKIELLSELNKNNIPKDIDVIVILDLNDITRIKKFNEQITNSKALKIVIDHHQEPKKFADYYLVDTSASSTGEILYKLLCKDKNIKWSLEIVENLYVAIMTDTGNFRFERTDSEVHRIVADLIEFGADPVKLYNEVYNKISFNAARLMGIGYSRLESFFDNKLVIMGILHNDFIETNTKEEDTEGFVESLLSIDNVVMAILMMEITERDEIRVSIRSKGNYSARKLALNFGGGGHINAAGCRFYNSDFNHIKQSIIQKAKEILLED